MASSFALFIYLNQAIFVKEIPKWFTGCFIVVNINQCVGEFVWKKNSLKNILNHISYFTQTHCAKYHKS